MNNKIDKLLIIIFILWCLMLVLSVINLIISNDFAILFAIGMCILSLLHILLCVLKKRKDRKK